MLPSSQIWSTICNEELVKYVLSPDYIMGENDSPWLLAWFQLMRTEGKVSSHAFPYFISRNDKVSLILPIVYLHSYPVSLQNIKHNYYVYFSNFSGFFHQQNLCIKSTLLGFIFILQINYMFFCLLFPFCIFRKCQYSHSYKNFDWDPPIGP